MAEKQKQVGIYYRLVAEWVGVALRDLSGMSGCSRLLSPEVKQMDMSSPAAQQGVRVTRVAWDAIGQGRVRREPSEFTAPLEGLCPYQSESSDDGPERFFEFLEPTSADSKPPVPP